MVLASAPATVLLVLLVLYFVPTIVGTVRKVPNIGSIAVLNFFLGWTLIFWVIALAMATRSVPRQSFGE